MKTSNSQVTVSKTIFPNRFSVRYETQVMLAPTFVADLYDRLVRSPTIRKIIGSQEIANLKGRDSVQQLIKGPQPPSAHELLFASGSIMTSQETDIDQRFDFRVTTPYKSSKAGKLFHHLSIKHNSSEQKEINIFHLGRIIPAELEFFRFGIQKYSSHLLSSLIGAAPMNCGSLLIDCSKDNLLLSITESGLKRPESPWSNSPILDSVSSVVHHVCDFCLTSDMQESLQTELGS